MIENWCFLFIFLSIVSISILVHLRRWRESLFSMGLFIDIGFIFFYGFSLFFNLKSTSHPAKFMTAYLLLIMAYGLYRISYHLVWKARYRKVVPKLNKKRWLTSQHWIIAAFILFCLSQLLPYLFPGGMVAYHTSRLIVPAGLAAFVAMISSRSPAIRFFGLFIVVVVMVSTVNAYSRRLVGSFLLAIGCYLFYFRPSIDYLWFKKIFELRKIKLLFIVVFMFAIVFVTGYRQRLVGEQLSTTDAFSVGAASMFSGAGFDTFLRTVQSVEIYPNIEPYLYGKSLFGLLVNPIPRVYWPDKPIAFGVELATLVLGVTVNNLPTNFGPGLVGEAWANGGWLSVILCFVALGIIASRIDLIIWSRASSTYAVALYSLAIGSVPFIIRGDFLNSGYDIGIKIIPVVIIITMFRGLYRAVVPRHSLTTMTKRI